jgi:hypothetical protein
LHNNKKFTQSVEERSDEGDDEVKDEGEDDVIRDRVGTDEEGALVVEEYLVNDNEEQLTTTGYGRSFASGKSASGVIGAMGCGGSSLVGKSQSTLKSQHDDIRISNESKNLQKSQFSTFSNLLKTHDCNITGPSKRLPKLVKIQRSEESQQKEFQKNSLNGHKPLLNPLFLNTGKCNRIGGISCSSMGSNRYKNHCESPNEELVKIESSEALLQIKSI